MNPSWQVWLAVAFGGGLGAGLRHLASTTQRGALVGVLFANTCAAGVLGVLVAHASAISPFWFALLGTGLCGALSTYSTFAVQVWDLVCLDVRRGIGYVFVTLGAGGLAALVPLIVWA